MINFIEHDQAGNICHVARDPWATIVPLVNRVFMSDENGNPLKSPSGAYLSPYPGGGEMSDPVEIDEATYDTLTAEGPRNYLFDLATQSVSKKAGA